MRFRSLCVDYYSEALQIEDQRRQAAGTRRPVIWLRNARSDNEWLPDDDRSGHNDQQTDESSPKNHTGATKCTQDEKKNPQKRPRQETDDDTVHHQATTTGITNDGKKVFRLTRKGRQRRRLQQEVGEIGEQNSSRDESVVTFQPPESYTRWMGSNSVSLCQDVFVIVSLFLSALNASILVPASFLASIQTQYKARSIKRRHPSV